MKKPVNTEFYGPLGLDVILVGRDALMTGFESVACYFSEKN